MCEGFFIVTSILLRCRMLVVRRLSVGTVDIQELSVHSVQFHHNPKISLKTKLYSFRRKKVNVSSKVTEPEQTFEARTPIS